MLIERMKQLQECRDEEEASQEEMATRFEREKTESMLVATAEDEECVQSRDVSRHFEDPSYGYKDFSRRGEHVPTFRVQVYNARTHNFTYGETESNGKRHFERTEKVKRFLNSFKITFRKCCTI